MKTSELIGPALDWAVAEAEGYERAVSASNKVIILREGVVDYFDPAGNWGWGGPIIEREDMEFILAKQGGHHESAKWMAVINNSWFGFGENHLIAAMRCYIASKLGDEAEIPEELL